MSAYLRSPLLLVPFTPTCPGELLGVGGRRRRRRRQGAALHPCWVGVSHGLPGTEQLCLVNGGAKSTYSKPCLASCCIQVEEPRDVLQRCPSTFSISSGEKREVPIGSGTWNLEDRRSSGTHQVHKAFQGCVSSHPAGEETLCGVAS